jgi:hypothetical protein
VDEMDIVKACVITWILLAIAIPCGWFVHYGNTAYDIDQAQDWVWRARATNDLLDMAKYLNESLVLLEPFDGNPNWWYPRPDTDFELIKTNIRECVANCITFSALENEMAYQQAVNNLQETEMEIASHLAIAGSWTVNTPFFTVWFYFGLCAGVVWMPAVLLLLYDRMGWW